jgi:Domain of unknown function (DUF1737)
MKYIIVCKENLEDAEREINEYMEEGYIPHGSPSIIQSKDGSFRFVQALVMPVMVFKSI